ncbi:Hsp70 family protein [Streptomyces sp. NPDC059009]|uniref:Hsp70 family protein n=1 Tax=Streptomyces sp. NPDC059009 TaxID=3346694 RepID=UPI0036B0A63C
MFLLDVISVSIGVEVQGGTVVKLIDRNSAVATKRSHIFTTSADNQPSMVLHFVEGEHDKPSENRTLAVLELEGIPPAPRCLHQVEVSASLDANSIVTFSAMNLGTGKEISVTAHPSAMEEATALIRSPQWTELRRLSPVRMPATTPPPPVSDD